MRTYYFDSEDVKRDEIEICHAVYSPKGEKRKITRDDIINFIKLVVLTVVTVFGFFCGYACLWYALGYTVSAWSAIATIIFTIVSEFGLFKLLSL